MQVELLKDWGDLKKGEIVNIFDSSVINAGLEKNIFQLVNEMVKEEKPEEEKPKKKKSK